MGRQRLLRQQRPSYPSTGHHLIPHINPGLTAEEEDLLKLGEGAAFNTSAVTLDSNSSPKAMPAEENMGKVTDESVPDDIEEEVRENKIDSMLRNEHIQKYNSDSSS